jgi:hypothetical protein
LFSSEVHKVHLDVGVSLPTGDIDQKGDTPAGANQKLPYPMQLGSGTWDFLPDITYTGHSSGWSWGSQELATIRLGENSNNHTLGDRLEVFHSEALAGNRLAKVSSLSTRISMVHNSKPTGS